MLLINCREDLESYESDEEEFDPELVLSVCVKMVTSRLLETDMLAEELKGLHSLIFVLPRVNKGSCVANDNYWREQHSNLLQLLDGASPHSRVPLVVLYASPNFRAENAGNTENIVSRTKAQELTLSDNTRAAFRYDPIY